MARKKLETLTEQMYYVLLSLWGEPRHGYGIMQYVSELTRGRVSIGAGTLYALLGRFEKEELIVLTDAEEGKKSYQLTAQGRQVLQDEQTRLRQQAEDGARILEGRMEK